MIVNWQPARATSHRASSGLTSVPMKASSLSLGLKMFGRRAFLKAGAAMKTLQAARMISTLSGMSDQQLAQIGISRSDIPEYSRTLIFDE